MNYRRYEPAAHRPEVARDNDERPRPGRLQAEVGRIAFTLAGKERSKNAVRVKIGLPFLLLGLALVALGIYLIVFLLDRKAERQVDLASYVAQAVTVQGEITSSRLDRSDGCSPASDEWGCYWFMKYDFTYVVEGKTYKGHGSERVGKGTNFSESSKQAARARFANGAVTVRYNPADPGGGWVGAKRLDDDWWAVGIAPIFFGAVSGLYGLAVVWTGNPD